MDAQCHTLPRLAGLLCVYHDSADLCKLFEDSHSRFISETDTSVNVMFYQRLVTYVPTPLMFRGIVNE